jgi:tetratricopeptide (TPR) repeat protein
VARKLGVKILAQGTAQGSGDTLSVTIRMDDVENDRPLLVREFKGSIKDLLAIEGPDLRRLGSVRLRFNRPMPKACGLPRGRPRTSTLTTSISRAETSCADSLMRQTSKKALAIFNQVVERDPKFSRAYTGIADASLSMFNATKDTKWTQQALAAAQQAQGLDEMLPEAHLSLGTAYTLLGQTGPALAELRRARELAPNSDDGLRRLARAYRAAGMQSEAITAFTEAIRVNPYLWTNHAALGDAYFRYGENEKALEAYHKVEALESRVLVRVVRRGRYLLSHGKVGGGDSEISEGDRARSQPEYYDQLSVTYFFLGRYEESAKMGETACQKQPNNPSFLANLADAYRWSKQPAKAAQAFEQAITAGFKAIQVNRKNIRALGVLATAHAKKGDAASASKFIQEARQIDREDNDLMYREATIHFPGEPCAGSAR